jgi:putative ATPase
MADSRALLVAVAAAHAVEHVGLPEARLNLAHATIYLARAPKSNSVYGAIDAAMQDALSAEPVPTHLRDASYAAAKRLGHGKGYRYPHDEPGHWVEQAYRPEPYEEHTYYEPSGIGEDTDAWEPGTGPSRPGGTPG